jgi:hypothetical protein
MNLEEAKEKVMQAIKEKPIYDSEYEIDENRIIETDFAWYIPFKDIHPRNIQDRLVGAYNGFIVGKVLGDLHQPGSAFRIEKWLTGYELGLLGGPHDLIVTKINNWSTTRLSLQSLHLTYHKPEIENGITWRVRIGIISPFYSTITRLKKATLDFKLIIRFRRMCSGPQNNRSLHDLYALLASLAFRFLHLYLLGPVRNRHRKNVSL